MQLINGKIQTYYFFCETKKNLHYRTGLLNTQAVVMAHLINSHYTHLFQVEIGFCLQRRKVFLSYNIKR